MIAHEGRLRENENRAFAHHTTAGTDFDGRTGMENLTHARSSAVADVFSLARFRLVEEREARFGRCDLNGARICRIERNRDFDRLIGGRARDDIGTRLCKQKEINDGDQGYFHLQPRVFRPVY